MDQKVTSGTLIRKLSYALLRELSDLLDPQDRWKDVIVSIRKPNGEPRYSHHHVRKFVGLRVQGKSPTEELLNDWGTSNSTVGELVKILRSHSLLVAADVLLPEENVSVSGTQQVFTVETERDAPTKQLEPCRTVQQTHTLQERQAEHTEASSSFLYCELMRITGNFDGRSVSEGGNRLGEGGFGTVYKGFLNNRPVAVKKLKPMEDMPLEKLQVQFDQEVQTLRELKHENLVDMVGFSCDQQLCLVYAFMENGSLLDRLACLDGSLPLTWQRRCLIAEGTARGLEYLHCNHHVHRDVKSANILLDENFVAKISDFGLTRASANRTNSTVMTESVVGTRAYMAPEALRGEITPKSDVFSFGVVLLEIISGRPPACENQEPKFLMDVRDDIDDEDEELSLEDIVDKKMDDWEMSQVETVYSLACNCLYDRKNRRPLIKQVVSEIHSVLKSISLDALQVE